MKLDTIYDIIQAETDRSLDRLTDRWLDQKEQLGTFELRENITDQLINKLIYSGTSLLIVFTFITCIAYIIAQVEDKFLCYIDLIPTILLGRA